MIIVSLCSMSIMQYPTCVEVKRGGWVGIQSKRVSSLPHKLNLFVFLNDVDCGSVDVERKVNPIAKQLKQW